jgi:protease-4
MRLVTAVALLSASIAAAQSAAVGSVDPSRGTTMLPGSAAFSDEATSLVYNPAGLGRVGRLNGWYLHERSNTRAQDNDAVFLATSFADWVGLGLGAQWLRPSAVEANQRFELGASVGPQSLAFGASLKWLTGGAVQGLTTLDLGVQSRPLKWLALGALVRNLNTPGNASGALPREWTLALGLRPLGERLSLGVDWVVPERASIEHSRLQYTVNAEILRGLRLSAGFSHGFSASERPLLQAGLGIDLERFGYTQGLAMADGRLDWQFAARLSVDRFGSIVPSRKIAVVSLAELGGGGPTLGSLLGIAGEDRYLRLLRFLDRARFDPELEAIVLKVEGASVGLARADEVRAAITRLRQAGKKVFAYILGASDADYLMVSACDGLYAAPEAMMIVDGLRSSVLFFGGAAKLLGVEVDVARVGPYKSFPDQFTRLDMSLEQRETIEAYLDANVKTVASRIEEARHLSPQQWQAALDEGLKPTRREQQLGTIDGVITPIELDALLKKEVPDAVVSPDYQPLASRDTRWARRKRIAIVPVLGNIAGGKNQPSPLGGDLVAGAQSFIEAMSAAAADPQVVAIVVRVDSSGGDGLASDLMYRAVLEAKKKKPVVSSMGDVAASGGYYVAMGGDEIFASPTTLTGSIGVFYAKPAIRGLAEKLGVAQVSLRRGKLAGITDLYDPWTPEQRAAAQRWVDDFYDTFITEVAASRKLPKERVDQVARGRVWSGTDALDRGLVDHLGGLWDAIAAAKARAHVEGDDVELTVVQPESGLLGSLVGSVAPTSLLDSPLPAPAHSPLLDTIAQQLGPSAWLLDAARPQARLEWLIEVE